jgi:hypothetical protein
MAKVKLGQKPKTFKRAVSFPMLDGTTGQIEMTFRYRTRSEFGAFIDQMLAQAGRQKAVNVDEFSMHELMAKTAGANADYVMAVAEGWDLEDEFCSANVEQLSDEVPAAVLSIMDAYKSAITEGRLGN